MVGLGRVELPTSPLSGVRSNQLSYRPVSELATTGSPAALAQNSSFILKKVSRTRLNMLSGYAARDHRAIEIKQRRPDQGSRIYPSGTAVTGLIAISIRCSSDSRQLASMLVMEQSAIAERSKCHLFSFRKEVIQPQVLLRLPCYDFTPIMNHLGRLPPCG